MATAAEGMDTGHEAALGRRYPIRFEEDGGGRASNKVGIDIQAGAVLRKQA